MGTPTNRTPVRIARGSTTALNTGLSDIQEGEIVWDTTLNKLQVKEGSTLENHTVDTSTLAPLNNPTFTGTVAIPNIANLETAVTANTAKVTNATHTGDVTGATALTIAADAVDGTKIADDAIDSEHYVDGSIDNAHLAVDAVTETRIQDASVTTAKITDANVTTAKIADANVTTAKIADSSVTAAKLDAVYGVLANDQNWTGAQRGALTTVTAAGTTTFDFDLGNNFYIDMATAAITTINASNATAGQSGSIIVKGHGSNTMAGWNAVYKFSGGTAPTITADATKYDRIDYIIYDASNIHMVWSGNY